MPARRSRGERRGRGHIRVNVTPPEVQRALQTLEFYRSCSSRTTNLPCNPSRCGEAVYLYHRKAPLPPLDSLEVVGGPGFLSCSRSPALEFVQPSQRPTSAARLDKRDAGVAATASRRRPCTSFPVILFSAHGVVDAHLCARRGAMTSSALTATCPSAPEIGMLVLQRYAALASLVRLRENDKCELRAAVLRLVVSTRHRHQSGLDGFSRIPNASSEDGFIRPKTSPL